MRVYLIQGHFVKRSLCKGVFGILLLIGAMGAQGQSPERPRARELGIAPGIFQPGPFNAITDVPGVRVGHVTLILGDSVRTGATAILPHDGNLFQEKIPAGIAVGNGFGKLMGSTQVMELGEIETPIVLTNTLSVPQAAEAILTWTLRQPGKRDGTLGQSSYGGNKRRVFEPHSGADAAG